MNRALTDQQTAVLREDIARARADLGETVEALAERADVRSRARASTGQLMERGRSVAGSPGPWLVLGAGVTGAVLAVLLARERPAQRWRTRRRTGRRR